MNKVKNIKITILIALLISLISFFVVGLHKSHNKNYPFRISRDNTELRYEGARAALVNGIDSVMRVVAPSTCMNGLEILRMSEKYGVDLFFILTQGQIESHFGTKGMALRTNSVFNVFAYDGVGYDNINPDGKYTHPDLSIEPYLKLIKKRYLTGGKTEMDLLHNYVDADGNRYASSKDYENMLTDTYKSYITNDRLINLYKQYTKYKILSGK